MLRVGRFRAKGDGAHLVRGVDRRGREDVEGVGSKGRDVLDQRELPGRGRPAVHLRGLGVGIQGSGFRVQDSRVGLRCFERLGLKVWGLSCGVWGVGCRV